MTWDFKMWIMPAAACSPDGRAQAARNPAWPLVRMLWPLVGMWWPLVGTRTDSRGCLRISGDARALASDHLRPRQKSARIARDSQTATAVCACSHQRPPHSDQRPQHSDQRPAIA